MKRYTYMTMLVLAMLSVGNMHVQAESMEGSMDHEKSSVHNRIVVTAQRMQLPELQVARSMEVLRPEDLKAMGVSHIFDGLSMVTGVGSHAYGYDGLDFGGMSSRISLRGLDQGTLVLLNGTPMNLNGKSTLDHVQWEHIDRIEVSKGANSTLYGAEALGGVINIITKTGEKSQAKISLTRGSFDRENYEAVYSDAKMYVGVTKEYLGDVGAITPPRLDKKDPRKNYYYAIPETSRRTYTLGWQWADKWQAHFVQSERRALYDKVLYNAGTPAEIQEKNVRSKYDDKKRSFTLTYQDSQLGDRFSVFYHDRSLDAYEKMGSHPYTYKSTSYEARNMGVDAQHVYTMGKHSLLVGMTLEKEQYKDKMGVKKADRSHEALYAQYTWHMAPRFTSILGVRGEWMQDTRKNQQVVVPQMQMLYALNAKESLYVNAGKAFLPANLSDIYAEAKTPALQQISGRNLKPEEGWNYELGYKRVDDKQRFTAAIFYMDYDNLFGWDSSEGKNSLIRINKGKFKNRGIELDYERKLSPVMSIKLGTSLSNPRNQEAAGSSWKLTYPKWQSQMALRYTKNHWDVGTSLLWVTKRPLNNQQEEMKARLLWNAGITYKPSEHHTWTLRVHNILNRKDVVSYSNYEYWGLPRTWEVTYSYQF